MDTAAYFNRIGYAGGREPTLANLRELVQRHTRAIAFENLSVLAGQAIELAPAVLERKLVDEQRGGYCFEHNLLLSHVLRQLGFKVTGLAARVLWNRPEPISVPRTHMLLVVNFAAEPYIVDVGFGGLTLTGVLRLAPDIEQSTPHEPFRLLRFADIYILQALVKSEWRALYEFDLQPQTDADYEPLSWYVSTHQSSRFVHHLTAARSETGRRFALLDNQLTVHMLGGDSRRYSLATSRELRESLERDFLIKVPDTPGMQRVLARIAAGSSSLHH